MFLDPRSRRSRRAATTRWRASSPARRVVLRRVARLRAAARSRCRAPVRARRCSACGAQLKNTFCLGVGDSAYLGPHIGDLDNLETYDALSRRRSRGWSSSSACTPGDRRARPAPRLPLDALRAASAPASRTIARAAPPRARRERDGRARPRRAGDRRRLRRHRLRHRRHGVGRRDAASPTTPAFERVATFRPLPLAGGDRAIRAAVAHRARAARRRVRRRRRRSSALAAVRGVPPRAIATSCARMIATADATRRSRTASAATSTRSARSCLARRDASYEGQVAMAWNLAADPASARAYPFDDRSTTRRRGRSICGRRCAPRSPTSSRGAPVATISARFHNTLVAGDGRRSCARVARARAPAGRAHRRLLPERAARRGRRARRSAPEHRRPPARATCRPATAASRSARRSSPTRVRDVPQSEETSDVPWCSGPEWSRSTADVALVDFWGVRKQVRLDVVDEPVAPGDYVLNHVGFAIRRIPAEDIGEHARALRGAAARRERRRPDGGRRARRDRRERGDAAMSWRRLTRSSKFRDPVRARARSSDALARARRRDRPRAGRR